MTFCIFWVPILEIKISRNLRMFSMNKRKQAGDLDDSPVPDGIENG